MEQPGTIPWTVRTAVMTAAILLGLGAAALPAAGAAPRARKKAAAATENGKAPPKAADAPLPALDKARWIWDSRNAVAQGAVACYFWKAVELPAEPTAATVLVTADNGYDLYVNGSIVGGDTGYDAPYWQSVERYDIRHLLSAGRNVLGVRGSNLGGPAGLIAAVRVDFQGRPPVEFITDGTWRYSRESPTDWTDKTFDGTSWPAAVELGAMGIRPWGAVKYPGVVSPGRGGGRGARGFAEPSEGFAWPEAVVFLTGRVGDSSTPAPQSVWRIGGSRAYLEMDKLGPSVLGRQMHLLRPARPDAAPRILLDAGTGLIGSPSASWDGRWVYFSMAPAGEKFFHVWRIAADGGPPQRLTDGPFHDFDPVELPDGRIAFSSTRIGSREEYHGNSARSLFVMNAEGGDIRPLTYHIVGDNEPRITADGLIAFIRCDNFLERAKVETQIHAIRPDGTAGQVLLGADRYAIGYDRPTGAEHDSSWLRRHGYGSPAPLPDGRVACLSARGPVVSAGGMDPPWRIPAAMDLFDLSPLPDGRLLCTVAGQGALGVLDVETGDVVRLHSRPTYDLHSPIYVGPRARPPRIADGLPDSAEAGEGAADAAEPTGFLLCQSIFATKQTEADVSRIRAVRVYEGRPFTLRSARHPYAHIGVEAVELGTAPVAPDGSFHVEVPADRALAIQAVDGEGRAIISELSWIYVRPGERRSCVGCHSPRAAAPVPSHEFAALKAPPIRLLGAGDPHRFRANNAANGGVLNLQLDRFREAAAIALYSRAPEAAGADMPVPSRADDVLALTDRLRMGDETARLAAAGRLAIFRDRAAAPALAQALRDRSADVRMNAALALAACGGRDAVPPLLAALDDPAPAVAQAAWVALDNLTAGTEPFDAYAAPAARRAAAETVRKRLLDRPWQVAEADLLARLSKAPPAERYRIVVALGHVGGDAARAALRELVRNDPGDDLRILLEALRALGHLSDAEAVGLLGDVLRAGIEAAKRPGKGFHEVGFWQRGAHTAAAAVEALGRIATPQAQAALLEAYPTLGNFWQYTHQTGDHNWLMGCHSSVVHYRMAEAMDAMCSTPAAAVAEAMVRAIPIDTDRGLLHENDAMETLTARVLHRSGAAEAIVEACLAVLGDGAAKAGDAWKPAVTASPPAVSVGPLDAESRAAQIASILCRDRRLAVRLGAAFDRYRDQPPSRKRSWTCFYLARALGKLGDAAGVDCLIAALAGDATEASFGRPDPPHVFLHNAMTPCYRAAAADALGRIGDRRAVPVLLAAVRDLDNAMDVRHAAATALAGLAGPAHVEELRELAREYPEIATRRALLAARAAAARNGPPAAHHAATAR